MKLSLIDSEEYARLAELGLGSVEIADWFGCSVHALSRKRVSDPVLRDRLAEIRARQARQRRQAHGTLPSYRAGCPCDECHAANAELKAAYRSRQDTRDRRITDAYTADQITEIVRRLGRDDEVGWQARALCAQTDPEAFFPEKGASTREARRICAGCEVRNECLESALRNGERFGVWGGVSERDRRRLLHYGPKDVAS